MRKAVACVILGFMVIACGAAVSTVQPQRPTSQPAPGTDQPPPPADTPAPAGPATYQAGDVITVQQNGEDWANITVSDVKSVGPTGYGEFDRPKTAGNQFIQANVTYEALADGVNYNPFDWQVFVDGQAVDNTTFVLEGPKPDLSSGTLPKGRKASGYVVYEVPPSGEVRMSYGGTYGDAPVFEVVLRK